MSRRAQENLIAGLLLATFIVLFVMALDFGPRARLVPLPIAGFAVALLLIQIVWQNVKPADSLHVDALEFFTGRDVQAAAKDAGDRKPTFRRELTAVGFVILLVLMYVTLSPIPAVFLFTAGYLVLRKHYGLLKSIGVAFAVAAVLLVTFRYGLGVALDETSVWLPRRSSRVPLIGRPMNGRSVRCV